MYTRKAAQQGTELNSPTQLVNNKNMALRQLNDTTQDQTQKRVTDYHY